MIVNGVTLPDIPEEAKGYSNFLVLRSIQPGSTDYMLLGCAGETLVVKDSSPIDPSMPDVYPNWLYLSKPCAIYERYEDEEEWRFDSEASGAGYQMLPMPMVTAELDGESFSADIFWADHVVMEATLDSSGVPVSTGIQYYPKVEEEPKPTRVSIGRSLVDGFAKEAQRLTGTTAQMNAVEIREKLSTVKAGIKIGDTVLPAIPEDVLAQYPNAMILAVTSPEWSHNNTLYHLLVSVSKLNHFAGSLVGLEYEEMLGNLGTGKILWTYANAEYPGWTAGNEIPAGSFAKPVGTVYDETVVPLWANHDIYEAVAVDMNTGTVTTAEVYFSERQNFNGVWLPKVPADVLAEYPCGVIIHCMETSGEMYVLIVTSNPWKYMSAAVWNPIMGSVVPLPDGCGMLIGFDSELKLTYHCSPTDAVWGGGEEDESSNDMLFPTGVFGRESYIPVWANNDIVEITAVIDADKNEFTYGDLYFPPLPAIDTDRVSIGYDLCDGIVEEVQRLSGESEKMNALHAYWKLTTVV